MWGERKKHICVPKFRAYKFNRCLDKSIHAKAQTHLSDDRYDVCSVMPFKLPPSVERLSLMLLGRSTWCESERELSSDWRESKYGGWFSCFFVLFLILLCVWIKVFMLIWLILHTWFIALRCKWFIKYEESDLTTLHSNSYLFMGSHLRVDTFLHLESGCPLVLPLYNCKRNGPDMIGYMMISWWAINPLMIGPRSCDWLAGNCSAAHVVKLIWLQNYNLSQNTHWLALGLATYSYGVKL